VVENAAKTEEMVVSAGIALEQVHHGYGIACWAVNRRGLDRGHGIRTGLEDITLLPDGKQARDNADLAEVRHEIDGFGYFDLSAGIKSCCLNGL
jgi:hypothetical protein